jgi:methylated-DNA-[protein]-cysteine S-methyltransferase
MIQSAARLSPRARSQRQAATKKSVDKRLMVGAAFETELGWVAVAFHENVLRGVVFGHPTRERATRFLEKYLDISQGAMAWAGESELEKGPRVMRDLIEKLRLMAAGEPVIFHDVKIDDGHLTPFGRRIVAACRRIPWGRTSSYGELAAAAGSPGAARAVGQVMAKNRYPLVVPCHRVLGAGGKIGGFSAPGRLNTKRRLLEMESDVKAK